METTLTDVSSAKPLNEENPSAQVFWRDYQLFFTSKKAGFAKDKCNYYCISEAGWKRVTEFMDFLEGNREIYDFNALIKVGRQADIPGDIYSLWNPETKEFGQNLYASSLQR